MDRRQFLLATVSSAGLACRRGSDRGPLSAAECTSEINRLFARRHEQRLFDGEALVAERGVVIYRGAFGLADRDARRPYTTDTLSCLASLSKPITAVAVMMLAEKALLTFENHLTQLLSGFSAAIGAVTIRQLLTHTSGVPDYPDLGVDHPGVTNAEILAALRRVQDPLFPPGLKYQYSNSGYVLLASIIEGAAGQTLPQFLAARIFTPLGMSSTFTLTSPTDKTVDVARGYDRDGDNNDFQGRKRATAASIRRSTTSCALIKRSTTRLSCARTLSPSPLRRPRSGRVRPPTDLGGTSSATPAA